MFQIKICEKNIFTVIQCARVHFGPLYVLHRRHSFSSHGTYLPFPDPIECRSIYQTVRFSPLLFFVSLVTLGLPVDWAFISCYLPPIIFFISILFSFCMHLDSVILFFYVIIDFVILISYISLYAFELSP
jgi:hypothetical protein